MKETRENREIKFRAWDKGTREFVDDVLITANKYGFLYQNWNRCEFAGEDRDIILMQYTGLKDKNGKEIYEGDIVSLYFRGENGVVTIRNFIEDTSHLSGKLGYGDTECEVIGNIHENPELL